MCGGIWGGNETYEIAQQTVTCYNRDNNFPNYCNLHVILRHIYIYKFNCNHLKTSLTQTASIPSQTINLNFQTRTQTQTQEISEIVS